MNNPEHLTPKQHVILEIKKAREMLQQHMADYLRMREDPDLSEIKDQLTDLIYDCLTILENYKVAINENS